MTKYIGPKTDGENVATQADVGGSALSDDTPDALTPDQAGAAGTVNAAARADHAHEILCAAAGAILPDDVAAEGTASSFARSDHTHSISTAAPGTITPDASSAEGSSNSFARADHTHAIVAAAPATTLSATTTNAEGNATSFARSNHTHAISTGTPGTIQPDDAAAAGTSASLARADHTHAIAAASAGTITGVSNTEGTSTSFARADHTHAISLPRCRALRSGTQSLANSTTTAIAFNGDDDYDTDNFHNPASNNTRITIPSGLDGVYLITCTVIFAANATGNRIILLYLNGVSTGFGSSSAAFATQALRLSLATQRNLVATDYIEVFAFQSSGGSLDLQGGSALEIVRLG